MSFRVRFTREAESDLAALCDAPRQPAESLEDARRAIRAGVDTLRESPFTCRKAGDSPFLRELIVPTGVSGYVALFEIVDQTDVVVSAFRRQFEEDYL